MITVAADLHVHSPLSACADATMTPRMIVYAAIAAELDLIAICDHNNAGNVAVIQSVAREIAGDLFSVIAGMEITTSEEAHVLGLFPDARSAVAASDALADFLPALGPRGNPYGKQRLMNAGGDIVGEPDRLLSFAAALNLSETVALIRSHGGVVIAAHIDRPSFSVISQLGFLPGEVTFDALEISAEGVRQGYHTTFQSANVPLLTASDAHFHENIGDARSMFRVENASFEEIQRALRREGGRDCFIA